MPLLPHLLPSFVSCEFCVCVCVRLNSICSCSRARKFYKCDKQRSLRMRMYERELICVSESAAVHMYLCVCARVCVIVFNE